MDINKFRDKIKAHPNYKDAGMVLFHNGIVRETSRDGRKVSGLKIEVDQDKLAKIVEKNKKRQGIIEILVEINHGVDIKVGDDVMIIAVAGDIRDNVIPALTDTLNEIKSEVSTKTEFFI